MGLRSTSLSSYTRGLTSGFLFVFSGRGNSAFETADAIYGHTNLVHMIGRSRVRLSWETHYVGDLRWVQRVQSVRGGVEEGAH